MERSFMNGEVKSTDILVEVIPKVDEKIIEETLTRMGIPNMKDKILYQSCHLLKQFGDYYICHFKQLFTLGRGKDGFHGFGNVSLEDISRRDSIVFCLEKWGMVEVVNKEAIKDTSIRVFVLPFKERGEWKRVKKYNIDNIVKE